MTFLSLWNVFCNSRNVFPLLYDFLFLSFISFLAFFGFILNYFMVPWLTVRYAFFIAPFVVTLEKNACLNLIQITTLPPLRQLKDFKDKLLAPVLSFVLMFSHILILHTTKTPQYVIIYFLLFHVDLPNHLFYCSLFLLALLCFSLGLYFLFLSILVFYQ